MTTHKESLVSAKETGHMRHTLCAQRLPATTGMSIAAPTVHITAVVHLRIPPVRRERVAIIDMTRPVDLPK